LGKSKERGGIKERYPISIKKKHLALARRKKASKLSSAKKEGRTYPRFNREKKGGEPSLKGVTIISLEKGKVGEASIVSSREGGSFPKEKRGKGAPSGKSGGKVLTLAPPARGNVLLLGMGVRFHRRRIGLSNGSNLSYSWKKEKRGLPLLA